MQGAAATRAVQSLDRRSPGGRPAAPGPRAFDMVVGGAGLLLLPLLWPALADPTQT